MIKQNIKFLTTGQFLTFSHTCKNLSSDVRIQDLENHNRVDINGKDLSELATIQLGLPFLLVIHGEDEKMARRTWLPTKYRYTRYLGLSIESNFSKSASERNKI